MTHEERIARLSEQIEEARGTLVQLESARAALQREQADEQRSYLQRAADALLADLGVEVMLGEPVPYAPNGERYECLTSGGLKAEGEILPLFSDTAADAVASYLEWLRVNALYRGGGVPAICWWRERPVVEGPFPPLPNGQDDLAGSTGKFAVYSRLRIAPKP